MSGICDTCKRMDCYMEHDGDNWCSLYLNGKPSNYKKLFGTPERAARTFMDICDKVPNCGVCQISETIEERCNYDALLEWLRSDT